MRPLILALVIGLLALFRPAVAEEQLLSKLEPITIATEDDAKMFTVEIADTDALRARGLMFRQRLPEDRGMLFDFGTPREAAMWMKNTYIPLDMLFIRADGTIAYIAENTVPSLGRDHRRAGAGAGGAGACRRDHAQTGDPAG